MAGDAGGARRGFSNVARWTALVTAGRILAAAASALWIAVLARRLDGGAFGDLMLLVALSTVFAAVGDGGVSVELCHQVGARPDSARAVFRRALGIRLRLIGPALVLMAVAYLAVSDDRSYAALSLLVLSTLATAVHQLAVALCRSAGWRRVEPVADIVPRVGILLVGIALGATHTTVATAALLYAVADCVLVAVLLVSIVPRLRGDDPVPDPAGFSRRRLTPRAIGLAVWSLQQRALVWVVALLAGGPELARFAAALRVSDVATLPATAVGVVSVPHLAASDRGERASALRSLLLIAVCVGLPIAVVGALDGGAIAALAFGDELRTAGPALSILLVGIPLAGAAQVVVQVTSAHAPGVQLRGALWSIASMIAVAAVAVPAEGARGAAIATVVGHAVLVASLWASSARVASVAPPDRFDRNVAASRSMAS